MSAVELTEAEREFLRDASLGRKFRMNALHIQRIEAILAARLAPVEAERLRALSEMTDWRDDAVSLKAERDEARANRDRLAHENAALRRQVADLTAERDRETERADHLVAWKDMGFRDRDRWQGRAEAAERALAAGLTLAQQWRGRHDLVMTGDSAAHDLSAALVGPTQQPDEAGHVEVGYGVVLDDLGSVDQYDTREEAEQALRLLGGLGLVRIECHSLHAPPTTDAEEARTDDRM